MNVKSIIVPAVLALAIAAPSSWAQEAGGLGGTVGGAVGGLGSTVGSVAGSAGSTIASLASTAGSTVGSVAGSATSTVEGLASSITSVSTPNGTQLAARQRVICLTGRPVMLNGKTYCLVPASQ